VFLRFILCLMIVSIFIVFAFRSAFDWCISLMMVFP